MMLPGQSGSGRVVDAREYPVVAFGAEKSKGLGGGGGREEGQYGE